MNYDVLTVALSISLVVGVGMISALGIPHSCYSLTPLHLLIDIQDVGEILSWCFVL